MKIGINIWSYPKTLSIKEALTHAKKTGYMGFELSINLDDLNMSESQFNNKWNEIRELVSSINVEIPSIATGLFWRFNPIIDEDREKALKIVERECIVAQKLNAKVILVVPAVAISNLSFNEHFNRTILFLREASKIAYNYNVIIGVENVWNRIFGGPIEFLKLLEDVNEDNVKAYFDVGNTLPHSIPEHWIEILKNHIVQVHVKDFNLTEFKFGIPLTGDVNWKSVIQRLKMVNYNGYLIAEVPPYKGGSFKAAEDTYTSLKKIIET